VKASRSENNGQRLGSQCYCSFAYSALACFRIEGEEVGHGPMHELDTLAARISNETFDVFIVVHRESTPHPNSMKTVTLIPANRLGKGRNHRFADW